MYQMVFLPLWRDSGSNYQSGRTRHSLGTETWYGRPHTVSLPTRFARLLKLPGGTWAAPVYLNKPRWEAVSICISSLPAESTRPGASADG